MRITNSEYFQGIRSLHHLVDMLYISLLEVMPSAELARTGAYGWRGFCIRHYRDLAAGHYFCQFYSSKPTVLLMEEFYNYGGFFYPWRVDLDLLHTGFFQSDKEEQKKIIVDFYGKAVSEALVWQNSVKRHAIVPKKVWHGRKFVRTPRVDDPDLINRVSSDYIEALGQQDHVFFLLKNIIDEQAGDLGIQKLYQKFNQSGWGYRGIWVKPRIDEAEDEIPEGSFPYHFKIDQYDRPEVLRFQSEGEEIILDLAENYFFSLDDVNQRKTLKTFTYPIMENIRKEINKAT